MADRPSPRISSRKQPKQARSTGLVEAILEAAVQVLAKEGAQRFTTARVAKKAAILFRLQSDEWRQTGALLHGILEDKAKPPPERLRALVHAFIASECQEAAMRVALNDAAPLYRDAPEALAVRASAERSMKMFMQEALPQVPEAKRALAGRLMKTTLREVGKHLSESTRTAAGIEACGDAMTDMV